MGKKSRAKKIRKQQQAIEQQQKRNKRTLLYPLMIVTLLLTVGLGYWAYQAIPLCLGSDCKTDEAEQAENPAKSDMETAIYPLTPEEANTLIQNEPSLQIVDVRQESEYLQGHIANSVLLPLDSISNNSRSLDKNQPVLLYCRTGNRSSQAAALLKLEGFSQLYDLEGGIQAWEQSGYPILTDE